MSFKVYISRLISRTKESLLNIDLIVSDSSNTCFLLEWIDHYPRSFPIRVRKIVWYEDKTFFPCKKTFYPCKKEVIDYYFKYVRRYLRINDSSRLGEYFYRNDFPEPGGSGENELVFNDLASLQRNYLLTPLVDQKHNKETIYDKLSEPDRMSFGLSPNVDPVYLLSLIDEHRRWEEPEQTTNDKLSAIYANNSLFGRF